MPADDPAGAARLVVDLVARRLPARYGYRAGEIQVLAPMHRGEAGVGALNALLQERLNPAREGLPEARGGGRAYRPGDRVLQLRNDYERQVFNGDLGTVRGVDPSEGFLAYARRHVADPRVAFESGSAMGLPAPDRSFDEAPDVALLGRAELLLRKGDVQSARALLGQSFRLFPGSEAWSGALRRLRCRL